MSQGMLVILGQKNIKKLRDFADLSSDELIGGYDEVKGKKIRIEGYLEEFSLSRKEADELIMAARKLSTNNGFMEKDKKKTLTISTSLKKKNRYKFNFIK